MVKNLKYLCIFGGGAIRGFSYLGVLKAFEELGFEPEAYAGASVGAIFAAFCAIEIPLEEMQNTFTDVNFELFKDINFSFGSDFAISKGGVFTEWLRENIEKTYYKDYYKKGDNPPVRFADVDKELIIIASNLSSCTPFIFSKETTPDFEIAEAVRISASMPGLLKPVSYEGSLLSDGDIMKSWPLWRLSDSLCPDNLRILEFRLEGIKEEEDKNRSMLEYLNTLHSCLSNYATEFITDLYNYKDKFDYIKINTEGLLIVNFNISKEEKKKIADIGYQAAMEFFRRELPKKKKSLALDYEKIITHLNSLKVFVEKNKINKAKEELGDLFIDLCEGKKSIDTLFYEEIINFKNFFFKNIKKTVWQNYTLSNTGLVTTGLLLLIHKFRKKIDELNSYRF